MMDVLEAGEELDMDPGADWTGKVVVWRGCPPKPYHVASCDCDVTHHAFVDVRISGDTLYASADVPPHGVIELMGF